jgi:hypothetical protein
VLSVVVAVSTCTVAWGSVAASGFGVAAETASGSGVDFGRASDLGEVMVLGRSSGFLVWGSEGVVGWPSSSS